MTVECGYVFMLYFTASLSEGAQGGSEGANGLRSGDRRDTLLKSQLQHWSYPFTLLTLSAEPRTNSGAVDPHHRVPSSGKNDVFSQVTSRQDGHKPRASEERLALLKFAVGAGRVAQRVKMFAGKPDNSMPRAFMVEGESPLHRLPSDLHKHVTA